MLLLRSGQYALRGGFLVRPLVIALLLGAAGALLSDFEEAFPAIDSLLPHALFPSRSDPQVAQLILSSIATSIMTVVSIVFAILLMTLTLASVQFSPRILVSFVRDRTTQWTLGIFLGTFSYCMAALPSARSLPVPFTPAVTVAGAMLLALLCVGGLIYFIHHVSQSISVNHIVDRIARETERVIDEVMPHPRNLAYRPARWADGDAPATPIDCRVSGYIRFIDTARLLAAARDAGLRLNVTRRVGQFVPEGVALLRVNRADRLNEATIADLLATFDIGPMRTLQQDVEFGVLQIVDIALKAISPAVNDPSTAISCIDQLSRVMIRWISRREPDRSLFDPPHVERVAIPWVTLDELLDTAFEQIRHYATGDLAVSLRLLRALGDIAATTASAKIKASLLTRAEVVVEGCRDRLGAAASGRLEARLALLRADASGG